MEQSFTVVIDTQEKKHWTFTSGSIQNVIHKKLHTGDYTVEGLEDLLCIERKMSVAELAQNINQSRFAKFLERMSNYRFKYLLLEADLQDVIDYPLGTDLPKEVIAQIKISGAYLLKCINRMEVKYGVHFIFCGNRYNATWVATNIMKEVVSIVNNETENKDLST